MPSTGRTVGTAEGFAPRAVLHDRGAPHAVSREQEERPRVLTFPHLPRTGVFPRVPRARAKLCTAAARQDGGTDRKQRAGGRRSAYRRCGTTQTEGGSRCPRYRASPGVAALYLPPPLPAWAPERGRQPIAAPAARRGPSRHWAPELGSALTSCPAP